MATGLDHPAQVEKEQSAEAPLQGQRGCVWYTVLFVHSCLLVLRQGLSRFYSFAAHFWLAHRLPDHSPVFDFYLIVGVLDLQTGVFYMDSGNLDSSA